MILVDKVTKQYGDKKVLDDVSFKIEGGELVTIVGNSGAGKTTLMHALIGAIPTSEGNIKVDSYELPKIRSSKLQEYRRKIGTVFQDYRLLPRKTVFENVAFALEVAGYSQNFIEKRTIEVLQLTGLERLRNHFPQELSGGEQQRTAIARALVHAPELLFADEPTGNLDSENTIALAKLFKKINQSGTTVVIATHDKEVMEILNNRIITLEKGKLISDKRNT